jgi:hypothetical protein
MAHKTRIHKQRELLGLQYEAPQQSRTETATSPHKQLEHYQQAMEADLASLKALKTVAEKVSAKATMLDAYLPFVDEYMQQGHHYPNTVAVQVMIWLIDTGNIDKGLNLGLLLDAQGQKMPPKFANDLPTFLCDNVYDWAAKLLKSEPRQSASPYLDVLCAEIQKEKWDLHPLVSSKMFAMLAKHKERFGDWQACFELCQLAEHYNPDKAGVKQLKERALTKIH